MLRIIKKSASIVTRTFGTGGYVSSGLRQMEKGWFSGARASYRETGARVVGGERKKAAMSSLNVSVRLLGALTGPL